MSYVGHWVVPECHIEADYAVIKDSFDHDHGVRHETFIELANIKILHYIDGKEFDVTDSVKKNNTEVFERYEKILLEHAKAKLSVAS